MRLDKVGTHKTTVSTDAIQGGYTRVKYHETEVVIWNDLFIHLDTGGWYTATTKARMNQASNQYNLGYHVYQHKGEWYVDYKGETLPFTNQSITLER